MSSSNVFSVLVVLLPLLLRTSMCRYHLAPFPINTNITDIVGDDSDDAQEENEASSILEELHSFSNIPTYGEDTIRLDDKSLLKLSNEVYVKSNFTTEPPQQQQQQQLIVYDIYWCVRATEASRRSNLPYQTFRAEFAKVTEYWNRALAPNYYLREDCRAPNIIASIQFREHGDGNPFDGNGGILAHAFLYGATRGIHLDFDEIWIPGDYKGDTVWRSWMRYYGRGKFISHLASVLRHELGHALGLVHTRVRDSVMGKYARWFPYGMPIFDYDYSAIRDLYYNFDSLNHRLHAFKLNQLHRRVVTLPNNDGYSRNGC